MISFAKIMRQVLTERLSFRDLLRKSEPGRKDRAHDVRTRSLRVAGMDQGETWTFRYKSNPSTTGNPWHGHILFFKEDVSSKENAIDLDCMVDCDCPDYRYRFAYNNARADAGQTGEDTLNQNNGQPPRDREKGGVGNLGEGMCKHLIALGKYLRTEIDAPEPDDEEPEPTAPKPAVPKVTPETPTTTDAPDPEDSYTDSRSDSSGYTDSRGGLSESSGQLYKRMDEFFRTHPEFEVQYEEDIS